MNITSLVVGCLICSAGFVFPAVHQEEVVYTANGVTMKGVIAYNDTIQGKRPGVLVVPEWWGLNDYPRKRASMLAELGYTAFAVDMYGEGKVVSHPDDAGKLADALEKDLDMEKARFLAAMEVLKKHKTTDPNRIAAIGYCMGGSIVLEMARQGVDLKGIVSFHGGLETKTPAQPGAVKGRILICRGAEDPWSPETDVAAFKKEMDNAKANYRLISYPNAKHSFTNPAADENGKKFNLPLAYNAEADKQSWADMKQFFDEIFKD